MRRTGGRDIGARNGGVRGASAATVVGGGIYSRIAAPSTLTEKLLANPHAALRRVVPRFEPQDDKENTSYSRGEKWWGSNGERNLNLTAQAPLLDGVEGELLSPTTVTVEGIPASETGVQSGIAMDTEGGTHGAGAPSPGGTTKEVSARDDKGLPGDIVPPGATMAGTARDQPSALFPGLDPPRLETTGEQVTGADTPRHRIENKR